MSFTRIPDKIIDELRLNPYQFQILSIIIRKTDGWCKVEDGISLSQFESLVSFKKPKIISTLKDLIKMNLIQKRKQFNANGGNSYSSYKVSDTLVTENYKGSKSELQGGVCEDYTQKKPITKENITLSEFDDFLSQLKKASTYKTKVTKTKGADKLFNAIKDKEKLFYDYIKHQLDKQEFSVRITAFMEDYNTVYSSSSKVNQDKPMTDEEKWGGQ